MDERKNKFGAVFKERLACYTKSKETLKLKGKPILRPKRLVPYAALDIVEKEHQRLQLEGVIEPTLNR